MLEQIQDDMKQLKIDNRDMETRITNTITQKLDEKFNNIDEKQKIIEKKIENQEKRLKFVENQLRKKNILFFGVAETESSYRSLENNILQIINSTMKIKLMQSEIEAVTRRGKKEENKVRPIALTLTTLGKKIQILKNKKTLEQTCYYLKEDFSPEILEKRRNLAEEVQKLRKEGQNAVLKYDRIVVLNNRPEKITGDKQKNNKRNLSVSPETPNTSSGNASSSKTNKKN